jgi:quinol monooxygenase YgiN
LGDEISWWVELAVEPRKLRSFRVLTRAMMDFTHQEVGILNYDRFITEDGRIVHAYERYVNSAAASVHLQNFLDNFEERFSNMVDRIRFTVYGNPSAELKGLLDRFGVIYLRPFVPST